jgi:hypothetical protein
MTNEDIITVKRLRRLYRYHSRAAESCENWAMHDEIMEHASWLLAAVKMLERLEAENQQLRERLVRQACYFEHIEAVNEPRWPLLDDEDDPGAGL